MRYPTVGPAVKNLSYTYYRKKSKENKGDDQNHENVFDYSRLSHHFQRQEVLDDIPDYE